MALIKTGSIVADISGKVGNNIYSRNRGGPYVKQFAAPVIPGSSYVTDVKAAMTDASAAWASLSDSEVLAWSTFAKKWPRSSFHDGHRFVQPRSLFIGCFLNQVAAGVSPGPLPVDPPSYVARSLSLDMVDNDNITYLINGESFSTDIRTIYRGNVSGSPSVRSFNSIPLYVLQSQPFFTGFVWNLAAELKTRSGIDPINDTNRIFGEVYFIHAQSGLKIGELRESILGVGAGPPSFIGNDTIGPDNVTGGNASAQLVTAPAAVNVDSISVYLSSVAGSFELGIYAEAGGAPGAQLLLSGPLSHPGAPGWYTYNLPVPYALSSGTDYFLACRSSSAPQFRQDSTLSGLWRSTSPVPIFSNPFGSASSVAAGLSIFASIS